MSSRAISTVSTSNIRRITNALRSPIAFIAPIQTRAFHLQNIKRQNNDAKQNEDSELQTQNNVYNHSQNSFANISARPFSKEACEILMAPLEETDVEIKPDNILYLPEIKYRRILNKAFGPGGWALMPRGPYTITKTSDSGQLLTQEFALFCQGQYVAQAHGEQIAGIKSIATALEGAKSNAIMRCCKDIGIASELWDPQFILDWKSKHAIGVWCENQKTNQKKILYRRKDRPAFTYPYKEVDNTSSSSSQASKSYSAPKKTIITPESTFEQEEFYLDNESSSPVESTQQETPEATDNSTDFDINSVAKFGKFKGRKWIEVVENNEKELTNYLSYLKKNNVQPKVAAALEDYLKKRA